MTRRRWALLGAAAILVVVLVGGRWSAMQTAERAWAATIPNGAAYLRTLSLARTIQWIVALAATLWGVGHCYGVYRAIGSVQMPRRLGDIEIVEAVPHRLLIAVTLIGGLAYGGVLTWAIGDVWQSLLLAASPPHFGLTDSVLQQDLGYYLGELPWARARQGMLLGASLSASCLIAILYAAIGSLRLQSGRLAASPHARAHLGLTLAALALAFVWGAHLDPSETVTGLVGPVTHDAIAIRGPAAGAVAVIGLITAAVSAAWGWWDRPGVVGTAWLALFVTMLGAYVILPPGTRSLGGISTLDRQLLDEKTVLEGVAFGAAPESWSLPAAAPAATAAAIPVWDPMRIRMCALRDSAVGQGLSVYSMTLEPSGRWLLGLAPDGTGLLRVSPPPTWESVHEGVWSQARGPLEARQTDSPLTFVRAPGGPASTWFGGGFLDYAVVDSGRMTGIPLSGTWRRLALAWTLQAPELARRAMRGRTLVWRRDAVERFQALAPFARFEPPAPVLSGDSLWWVSWGSVEGEAFPLVDTVMVHGRSVRYRQPGLVGALNAVSGSTRLWLAPQTDSPHGRLGPHRVTARGAGGFDAARVAHRAAVFRRSFRCPGPNPGARHPLAGFHVPVASPRPRPPLYADGAGPGGGGGGHGAHGLVRPGIRRFHETQHVRRNSGGHHDAGGAPALVLDSEAVSHAHPSLERSRTAIGSPAGVAHRRRHPDGAGAVSRARGRPAAREARQRLCIPGARCGVRPVDAGGAERPPPGPRPHGWDADGGPAPRPGPLRADGFGPGRRAPRPIRRAVRQSPGPVARHFARRCPLHRPPLGCAAVTPGAGTP